ncbi:hypothetical protein [Nonomuraea sp. NPDC049725]|uniref:hypothetical protein n=1 Tax=Nonomuraea sp. NPDC049725 TaxID=3154508 RepID=UPI00341B9C0C
MSLKSRLNEVRTRTALVEYLHSAGDTDETISQLESAVAIAREIKAKPLEKQAAARLAEVLGEAGRP